MYTGPPLSPKHEFVSPSCLVYQQIDVLRSDSAGHGLRRTVPSRLYLPASATGPPESPNPTMVALPWRGVTCASFAGSMSGIGCARTRRAMSLSGKLKWPCIRKLRRSEEHTSELQSLRQLV